MTNVVIWRCQTPSVHFLVVTSLRLLAQVGTTRPIGRAWRARGLLVAVNAPRAPAQVVLSAPGHVLSGIG